MPTSPRPAAPRGNDPFPTSIAPGKKRGLALSYWDAWLIVVVLTDFGGDWALLADRLRAESIALSSRHETAEGLLNHLRALRQRLADASLTPAAALGPDGPSLVKTERRRARRAVFEQYPKEHDKSAWMKNTPRRERQARARRGFWPQFGISPASYAGAMQSLFKTSGYYTEDQSFGLNRKLYAFLERAEAGAAQAEAAALYRAFLTVILEKMDMIDDSYGVIGDLYGDIMEGYQQLGRVVFAATPDLFFQDLLEFMLWEDYGFDKSEQPAFFASLSPAQAALAETILRGQWQELRDLALEHQAEEALTLLGMLCTQQNQFDKFVDLAREMGSRKWQRIAAMSAMAEKKRRPSLALAVYEASLGPGMGEHILRKQFAELQERLQTAKRKTGRKPK